MTRLACTGVLVLALVAASQAAPATQAAAPVVRTRVDSHGARYDYGRLVVKLANSAIQKSTARTARADAARDRIQACLPQLHLDDVRAVVVPEKARAANGTVDLSSVFIVEFDPERDPLPLVRELEGQPDVVYAEPLYIQELALEPDDLHPDQRAALEQIRLPQAWDVARGEQGGVLLAIVDSGVDIEHPDLAANIWRNPREVEGNGRDDDGNGYIDDVHGWSFTEGSNTVDGVDRPSRNADHGTLVAGTASAVTNNGTGMAGAAWNVRILPVRVAHPTLPRAIRDGYLGILYAVENGAAIVNLSWSGTELSAFERDVVDWAWEQGATLVAAAGNVHEEFRFYPAAFRHVLTVASIASNDVASHFTTFGGWVDLGAPGENILATALGGGLQTASGTSLASPFAAGVCALVKTRWPAATPDEVMARVRMGCDPIDALNPDVAGLLGRGRLNAFRALTEEHASIRIVEESLADADGDGIVDAGEQLRLRLRVQDQLVGVGPVAFELSSASSSVAVLAGTSNASSMPSGATHEMEFLLQVAANAPVHEIVRLRLGIDAAADGYSDADYVYVHVQPGFVDHDANRIRTSLGIGRVGHAHSVAGTDEDGAGFHYKDSEDLVADCGLMLGVSPEQVSDAVRDANTSQSAYDPDFVPRVSGLPTWESRGTDVWQSLARFDDSGSPAPLGVVVTQEGTQFTRSPYDDFVLLRYTVTNEGPQALAGLLVGFVTDWSIDRQSCCDGNAKAVDPAHDLGYAWNANGVAHGFRVGIAVLTPPGLTAYQIIDDGQLFQVGFSTARKWACLSSGIDTSEHPSGNYSMAVGTGPFTIEPGTSITVGFAFLGGDDLEDLQHNVAAAKAAWNGDPIPTTVVLSPPRGNPALDGDVRWTLVVPDVPPRVRAGVYTVRGQRVRDLSGQRIFPGANVVLWDRRDDRGEPAAAGVYFLHVDLGTAVQSSKVVLLK